MKGRLGRPRSRNQGTLDEREFNHLRETSRILLLRRILPTVESKPMHLYVSEGSFVNYEKDSLC